MESGVHGSAGEELSSFVGRERELAELRALVPAVRALTLAGTAGIGKTRLAVRLVAVLADDFEDGAWFVELADLRQPDLVAARIAAAVGVIEEPGRPLLATLADALRPREILIALDNCEHLIDECARVCQRLLATAPGLTLVVTSREPLRVAAETVWQVPPLGMPSPSLAGIEAAELLRSDALRLFAERARAANADFSLSGRNLASIATICRSLDGLPLAIELAAAWVRALSAEQIASRLTDRFRLLSSAERTAPPRHRTLRAALDWSYDLLTDQERVLLRRLSVFSSWPLEMAEQVCAVQIAGADLPERDIVNLLTALADKSLVIAETFGSTRYRMLDTVREYAGVMLADAGEADLMHARFGQYGMAEMERMSQEGMALVPVPWSAIVQTFRRFQADGANISQILSRCLENGDAEAGLRICAATRPVWIVQGSFAEGAGWLDAFLDLDTSRVPDQVMGPAMVSRAQLALATDPMQAGQYAKAGLELCRMPGSEFWASSALNLLAEAALHAGQADEAAAYAREAISVARAAGERFNEGYAAGTLASLAAYLGDLDKAREYGETALVIAREIDQQWAVARALLGLADLARLSGDLDRARSRYTEALDILREVGARPEMARCLAGLGRIAITRGEFLLARHYLAESLELSRATGSRIAVIRALGSFAALATARHDYIRAIQLTAAAAALRADASLPEALGGGQRRVLDAAAELGPQAVEGLWAAGSALGSEAAISLALAPGAVYRDVERAAAEEAGDSILTARELEIATLVAAAHSNRSIAAQLDISPATVATHVANIMAKLEFTSRIQIAAWTVERATDRGTGR
jgi:predicted ATPase/DNA-binding NarL/FixJ family response regulator